MLTTRIAWLLQTGQASPAGIMAVTFTNKAAKEMQARLSAMLPVNARAMWIGTFHGLCNRFLRAHAQGWPACRRPFRFWTRKTSFRPSSGIIKALKFDEEKCLPKQTSYFIANAKEAGHAPKDLAPRDEPMAACRLAVYQAYEDQCQREGVVDFAELMLRTYEMHARQRPECVSTTSGASSHILVDEFQDTNRLQYLWLKMLAGDEGGPLHRQPACWPWATTTRASTPSVAPSVGNMADFRAGVRGASVRSSWSRTTAATATSWTRPTP